MNWWYANDKESVMEFDKSRVYTALNADELQVGDKVIVANNIADLKAYVIANAEPYVVTEIEEECAYYRIRAKGNPHDDLVYGLAYLVERAENCGNCGDEECPDTGEDCKFLRCADWKPIPIRAEKKECCLNCKYYNKVNDFRDCRLVDNPTCACPHYEAEKKYRPFKDTDELIKVWCDKGGKWQHRETTMPLIWVRSKDTGIKCLITEYADSFIVIDDVTYDMRSLLENLTFLDGSPCGVEEK